MYGLAVAIPNVALVPLSVLLLHDVGFWPVAVLAALPVPGALFALGSGRPRRGAVADRPGDADRAVRVDGSAAADGSAGAGLTARSAVRRALAPGSCCSP